MKTKIVVEQVSHALTQGVPKGQIRYQVTALTNRTRPMIGDPLSEDDLHKLLAEDSNLVIEVKKSRKGR